MSEHGDEQRLDDLGAVLRQWRQAHPDATLTELERELDRQWHARRVALLAEVAQADDAAVGDCPTCGTPLVRRGAHNRTVRSDGDQAIILHRSYAWCPVCHAGLFPPG
jgi:YgiT-type zinc finger domain-containing protein